MQPTHFKQIVSIVGEPGLFKALDFGSRGVIVETLDEKKMQTLRSFSRYQIISLIDISVYSKKDDSNIPLYEVFSDFLVKYENGIPSDVLGDKPAMRALVELVIPNVDLARVKDHELKKIVNWFNILVTQCPDLLKNIHVEIGSLESATA